MVNYLIEKYEEFLDFWEDEKFLKMWPNRANPTFQDFMEYLIKNYKK